MRQLLISFLMVGLLYSCKSQKIVYVKKTHIEKDTVITEKARIITLPQSNTITFSDIFLGIDTEIPTQIIKNENSKFEVRRKNNDLVVQFDSDSIISTDTSRKEFKTKVVYEEIPVEVIKKVPNKLNWYMAGGIGILLAWILRKPLLSLIKKLFGIWI